MKSALEGEGSTAVNYYGMLSQVHTRRSYLSYKITDYASQHYYGVYSMRLSVEFSFHLQCWHIADIAAPCAVYVVNNFETSIRWDVKGIRLSLRLKRTTMLHMAYSGGRLHV